MIKRTLLGLLLTFTSLAAVADEGMWLPSLISSRIGDMRAKGFELTAEDIYSVNQASMKDAVVLFNGGCTGELISDEGLLLTNHHCGYGAIQKHSTVEHDYLTNGFWAMSRAEELPNEKLYVRFLVRMEDVTERIAKGESQEKIIKKAVKGGENYKAVVEQMFYGNQYFLFVYQQFDDVRLVGAPPSSIGKFGGDTDNWVWPRHTGDFSLFRVYSNKNNEPADYSADNVPYKPKKSFTVSTKGIKEGDFTMIYGFPGNTQQYLISDAVEYIEQLSDPTKIDIRTKRLDIITAAQESDPALRIFYAANHASIANAWKKWQGELLGIKRLGTLDKKLKAEAEFEQWAKSKPQYANVISDLKAEYKVIIPIYFAREILNETIGTLSIPYSEKELADPLFEKRKPTELALWKLLFAEYEKLTKSEYRVEGFDAGVRSAGGVEQYAVQMFDLASQQPDSPKVAAFKEAIKAQGAEFAEMLGTKSLRNLNSKNLNELYKAYLAALLDQNKEQADMFPDANLTLRVAYGSVQGYNYADGVYHTPWTTIDGIIAKDNPEIYDYDIPQSLRDLYSSKEYGRWAEQMYGRTTVPVCFLATNHTTGGNSGSPILNAKGELVGLNFDRTWLSTMSDVEFDPIICRNISVDIRYVLFVVDKIGGASYLFDEMKFD